MHCFTDLFMQYDVGEGFRCRLKITRFYNLKCHANYNGGNSWPINFSLTLIMPAKFITICRTVLKKLYIQEDVLRLAQIYLL